MSSSSWAPLVCVACPFAAGSVGVVVEMGSWDFLAVRICYSQSRFPRHGPWRVPCLARKSLTAKVASSGVLAQDDKEVGLFPWQKGGTKQEHNEPRQPRTVVKTVAHVDAYLVLVILRAKLLRNIPTTLDTNNCSETNVFVRPVLVWRLVRFVFLCTRMAYPPASRIFPLAEPLPLCLARKGHRPPRNHATWHAFADLVARKSGNDSISD